MADADYERAYKLGKKEYNARVSRGEHPYLPVLDYILSTIEIETRTSLGLIDIPLDQIVGTSTQGRTAAFAWNFMPLLKPGSEFSTKWSSLIDGIIRDGQRDPIIAYEFMNRYYVVEGNKRVSVSKYLNGVSLYGNVTRIVPKKTDDLEVKIYYEYIDFYEITKVNYVWVSREGNFVKLLWQTGSEPGVVWSDDERAIFRSRYLAFSKAFSKEGGDKLDITPADAMVSYMTIYGYESLEDASETDIRDNLSRMWDEFLMLEEKESVALVTEPREIPERNILTKLISPEPSKIKAAFIYDKSVKTSAWVYSHELGRMHVEQVFADQLETLSFEDIDTDEKAHAAIVQAVREGCNVIFTTTPNLRYASLKAAVDCPDVKILNCSLNTSHRYIRTYYARMYEAKFLTGAIAGAMSENGRIGYIADYPIYGMTANINAFALGAKLVNPRSEIYLEWSTVKDRNIQKIFRDRGISFISNKEMITPQHLSRQFGLYYIDGDGSPINLAMPVWHWGVMYERILRSILAGTWKDDDANSNQAVNYWWGMSAGVIEVICSQHLPLGTKRLVDLLKRSITNHDFNPFYGEIYDQDKKLRNQDGQLMAPEDIITMNWLVHNVIGSIPTIDELVDEAKPVVQLSGLIQKEEILTPMQAAAHPSGE